MGRALGKRKQRRFAVKDLTISIHGKTYRIFNINEFGVGFLIDQPEEIEIGTEIAPMILNAKIPVRVAGIPRHISPISPIRQTPLFQIGVGLRSGIHSPPLQWRREAAQGVHCRKHRQRRRGDRIIVRLMPGQGAWIRSLILGCRGRPLARSVLPHGQYLYLTQYFKLSVGNMGQRGIGTQSVDLVGNHSPDGFVNMATRSHEPILIEQQHDPGHGLEFIHPASSAGYQSDSS